MQVEEINLSSVPGRLFITGIGTDVGKSWATGWLASILNKLGVNTITQKFIQTGCKEFSEDIETHRKIMGIKPLPRDLDHTTAPLILSYPASPDLAAKIDGVDVDFSVATKSTDILSEEFDCVLVEGAGGICVPLKGDYLTIDYVRENSLPTVLVTNGQLGSISHTLLALQAMIQAGIKVWMVIYNPHFDADEIICKDTRKYIREWLDRHLPEAIYVEMPDRI